MKDTVQRFLFEELDIRGAIVTLDISWQAITANRHYPAPVGSLLGQMCAVTALIGSHLKQAARLTFQVRGHGNVPLMVVDCSQALNLRGYAKIAEEGVGKISPDAKLPELLGDGQLLMSLDTEGSHQPYQSYVPMQGECVADIFEHYLLQSEQQPTMLMLAADQTRAVGIFLQKMPGSDQKDADGWSRITQLAHTLKAAEHLACDNEQVLQRLFHEEVIRLFEAIPVIHDFPPDWEKVSTMLRSLGREQIEQLLAEHGEIRILDDLSHHEYTFSPEQALALFEQTLH